MLRPMLSHVDLLILGAGWTSTFLIPLLTKLQIPHAATTRKGDGNSIPFVFDPSSDDGAPYRRLPSATTVLITFPLVGKGQSRHLVDQYRAVHGRKCRFIQLGSTGIFTGPGWNDHNSAYDKDNSRAIAEDELMSYAGGCSLNLAGLVGGARDVKHWMPRIAKTKEDVRKKQNVHLVYGEDVARAIVGTHLRWEKGGMSGKRWIVCDCRTYDWWDLILSLAGEFDEDEFTDQEGKTLSEDQRFRLQMGKWVGELMVEEGVPALPRDSSSFDKRLDSRAFWNAVGVWPKHHRV
ncbi:MAG: hypothetical protein M1828_003356 [Chrysothrix sp. TS-e1954]|nr:MAG: hypothetical protein M1828_003356 [Chrysothrix sp. TS-e1954]